MKTRVMQDGTVAPEAVAAAPPAPRPARPRRTGLLVGGAVAATLGAAALAGGAALVAVHATAPDADGWYTADARALSTPDRALVAEELQTGPSGPGWLVDRMGDVRITATGARDGPVFVGVAHREDVEDYLDDAAVTLTDFEGTEPQVHRAGSADPGPPAAQDFWERSASGPGAQAVVWPIRGGDWSAVVMNADGSAGVTARTELAARTDVVLWLGLGALVGGTALLGAGVTLGVKGRARRGGDAPV
ncbi:MAG: hypothetical protein AB7V62_13570 [Thermoleophilia bacterium]